MIRPKQRSAHQGEAPVAAAAAPAAPVGFRATSKIRREHLDRLAIVHVRQSSPHQVLENRESRERQYALAGYARQLGWAKERSVVIDEDQGLSGKSAENRVGFQRLMAEVSLNHVGIVLGLELSRLSRSNKDWHQLVDVCGIFNTLLCDQDGIYDAGDGNDRLLLGMKGAMSEFELVTLRNRLLRGTRNKAERGEHFTLVPVGYYKERAGQVIQDPDEQARAMIRLVFEKFAELQTVCAVFRYFTLHDLRLGFRRQRGEALLAGLVVCAKCGYHMSTRYPGDKKPTYQCQEYYTEAMAGLPEPCGRIAAATLDGLVAREVLRALQHAQLRARLKELPPLDEVGLWKVQAKAIAKLEHSFAKADPRALIQMATGSGKTFTAVNIAYRLLKFCDAKRILFLVDRGNLGKQTDDEFANFTPPDDTRKFPML